MGGEIELDMDAAEKALNRFFQTGGGYMPALCAAIRAYLAAAQPERKGAEAMREMAAEFAEQGAYAARTRVREWPEGMARTRVLEFAHTLKTLSADIRALPLPAAPDPFAPAEPEA